MEISSDYCVQSQWGDGGGLALQTRKMNEEESTCGSWEQLGNGEDTDGGGRLN